MKTSRANSFRLYRVGKISSVRKTSQTFYNPDESFKLAALNSVSRGVKHADISYITGLDLNKLRKQPIQANQGLYESAHLNLTEIRKKYDEIKKERVKKEERIEKLKDQMNKFQIFNGEYDGRIKTGRGRVGDLNEDLGEKKNQLETAIIQKKVLLNMQARHKKDRVFYDQKKFDLEKQLQYLRKQLNIFKKEGYQIDESDDRSSKIYEKLQMQIQAQREERRQHLENIQAMINQKQEIISSNGVREHQIKQIAERARQDKDLSQKQWRKIFMTHVFVSKVLRNKIEIELEKFKVVQFAFKEIKTATGVCDAKTLISKYLLKENVYGELLGKIAQNQKTIEKLKAETETLIKEEKDLEQELEVIQSVKLKSQDLHDDLKNLEEYDQKNKTAGFFKNKMGAWSIRQLKKFNIFDKKHEQFEYPKSIAQIQEAFKKYLTIIEKQLSASPAEISYTQKEQSEISGRDNQKITRIAPKKSRINEKGEEIFDVDEEETNQAITHEQHEVISSQRQQLHKINDKFMKQIKKKRDEERKLLFQKTKEKKEKVPKAPQPKKEED